MLKPFRLSAVAFLAIKRPLRSYRFADLVLSAVMAVMPVVPLVYSVIFKMTCFTLGVKVKVFSTGVLKLMLYDFTLLSLGKTNLFAS